jgi:hypothetical protein
VLDNVLKFNDHYPYVRGIIAACGFKRILVPYEWKRRRKGFSKIGLFELIDQALNGIFSFTNAPMRLCTFLGFGVAVACMLYALLTIGVYVVTPHIAPPGVISLVVGMFFLFALQLIFIGLLGEYVTSIHAQVRRGPVVIERERINLEAKEPSPQDARNEAQVNQRSAESDQVSSPA